MRHGNKINHLGRTKAHRQAMLANMASSLIIHKQIVTTVAKAKELRVYVEPLLTRAKDDTTHARRTVFSYLQDKASVKELFDNVAEKIADRPGGYTRILKLGTRRGDSAEQAMIELVDFNEFITEDTTKKKTRRSRRRGKGDSEVATAAAPAAAQPTATAPPENTDVAAAQPEAPATEDSSAAEPEDDKK